MSKFTEFNPTIVPLDVQDPSFPSVCEENFSALQKTITLLGQEITRFTDTKMIFVAGETLAAGDLVVLFTDGLLWKADSTTETYAKSLVGIAAVDIAVGKSGTVLLEGLWTTTGLTTGVPYYISETGGEWTTASPYTSGSISRVIGYSLSPTQMYFSPDRTWLEIA